VGAKNTYQQALSMSREVNDRSGIGSVMSALGTVLDALGDYPSARKMLDQAVTFDLQNGHSTASGDKLVDLGDLLQHQGDLAGAQKNYQEGLDVSRGIGDKSMAAYALLGLGNLEAEQANLDRAKKDYDESLALRNELGEKENADATRVAMDRLAIEEGGAAEAAASLRDVREDFRKMKNIDEQIFATCSLGRALLAAGMPVDAQLELEKVIIPAQKTQNLGVRLESAVVGGVVRAASGGISSARSMLGAAYATATKSGYVEYELEARLALAEIAWKPGHDADARAALEKLQREATAKGFDLIARKAAAIN
jgi:tetratricopeptide (TPR) repeat protein